MIPTRMGKTGSPSRWVAWIAHTCVADADGWRACEKKGKGWRSPASSRRSPPNRSQACPTARGGAHPDRANHPAPASVGHRAETLSPPAECREPHGAGRTVPSPANRTARPQSGGSGTGLCCSCLLFSGVLPPHGGSARWAGFSRRHRPGAAEEYLPQTRSGCQQPAEASTTASRAAGQSHARGCLHPPCDWRQGRC